VRGGLLDRHLHVHEAVDVELAGEGAGDVLDAIDR
jgi:hypothetical protein